MSCEHLLVLAYLDPASGSLAFQMAIGGLVSAGAVLRMYRVSLLRAMRRLFGRG